MFLQNFWFGAKDMGDLNHKARLVELVFKGTRQLRDLIISPKLLLGKDYQGISTP